MSENEKFLTEMLKAQTELTGAIAGLKNASEIKTDRAVDKKSISCIRKIYKKFLKVLDLYIDNNHFMFLPDGYYYFDLRNGGLSEEELAEEKKGIKKIDVHYFVEHENWPAHLYFWSTETPILSNYYFAATTEVYNLYKYINKHYLDIPYAFRLDLLKAIDEYFPTTTDEMREKLKKYNDFTKEVYDADLKATEEVYGAEYKAIRSEIETIRDKSTKERDDVSLGDNNELSDTEILHDGFTEYLEYLPFEVCDELTPYYEKLKEYDRLYNNKVLKVLNTMLDVSEIDDPLGDYISELPIVRTREIRQALQKLFLPFTPTMKDEYHSIYEKESGTTEATE